MAALSLPVLIAFIAEPLTGIVDTAFVARLGAAPVAALGVSTALLSSVLWVFNFLAIGTQTEVARSLGSRDRGAARDGTTVALLLSLALGAVLGLVAWPSAPAAGRLMGAEGTVLADAVSYLRLRLLGAPAVLLTLAAFGALRGLQDVKTPLRVSVVLHSLNIGLDATLIVGVGPIPAFGLEGAAVATVVAQWIGALLAAAAVRREIGFAPVFSLARVARLLRVGRDLFARTGLLLLFTLAATRVATLGGPETAAAHQATRQLWIFSAFVLDALAATAQTLVGFYRGADRVDLARRVAAVCCGWGLGIGLAMALVLVAARSPVAALLVPVEARGAFATAWLVLALAQPLNAVSFVTDGVHWGTGDYGFLRNAMLASTLVGLALLSRVDATAPSALRSIWLVTVVWMSLRSATGLLRIWPGSPRAPLGRI